MKKILIIGNGNSSHIQGLVKNYKKHSCDIGIDCLSVNPVSNRDSLSADHIYNLAFHKWFRRKIRYGSNWIFNLSLLSFVLFKGKNHYSEVQIHFISPIYKGSIKNLKRLSPRLIAVLWGSDLLRVSNQNRPILRQILHQCNHINVCTPEMRDAVKKLLEKSFEPCHISCNRIGLDLLEKIDSITHENKREMRALFDIKGNEKIITVGYNRRPEQQHLKIIDELNKIRDTNVVYIFPMTYGWLANAEYPNAVKACLKRSKFKYIVLESYLDDLKIAALRVITDVFIQLQITDVLSGAMQEHMYAGSVVITGSWLPYSPLKEKKAYFLTVDSIGQLSIKLRSTLTNLKIEKEKSKNNRNIIWELSSWENCIPSWSAL